MTSIIWKKAKNTYHAGLIRREGTGQKGEYYQVQDNESMKWHLITIKTDKYGTTFTCDCVDQSLPHPINFLNGKQPLCSHIICVIFKKYFDTRIK